MSTPKISIETVSVMGNDVVVIYLANDEWFDTTLSLSRLFGYAKYMELNVLHQEYFDSILGEIVQTTHEFDIETWFSENLEYTCKKWIEVYHVENKFETITYKLGELINETNK